MFEQLAVDARRVVVRAAEEEALALGSATVEAEHLLLALATDETGPVGRLLADAGLAHDGVIAALAREPIEASRPSASRSATTATTAT